MEFLEDVAGQRAGERRPAVSNVGYRPTFGDGQDLVAEAHVLDFSGDLYGCKVELRFLSRLREEHRFESVDALKEQIGLDVEAGRKWFSRKEKQAAGESGG